MSVGVEKRRFRKATVIITLVAGTASGNWGDPNYIGGTARQIELEYAPKNLRMIKTATGGTAGFVTATTISKSSVTLTSSQSADTGTYRVDAEC